ncbi:uncharacterized protein JCM6883_004062 [Sporobolomyces salmoneus]|uniref:uncharacterized protein n=1 Tax=Sporobolomyces salmoneus TaxID=183962 RepID=UPI00316BDD10
MAPSYDPDFFLITSMAYIAAGPAQYSEYDLHIDRLHQAHLTLARLEPDSWCAHNEPMDGDLIRQQLRKKFMDLEVNSRLRVKVGPYMRPGVEVFPLDPMPYYPVKLVLDYQPTEYEGDPFMFVKTTERKKYDQARERAEATLWPSDDPECAPFDVILFNPKNEITETSISNIAFKFSPSDTQWITPSLSSGLLAGVRRGELLKKGEIREEVVTKDRVIEAAREGTLKVICFNGVRGVFETFLDLD